MNEAGVVIRPARPADVPALGRFGAQLFVQHFESDRLRFMTPPGHLEEGYGGFLATQLDRDDVVVLVAEHDGILVGYVYAGVAPLDWMQLRDEAGFIHDVFVEPAARREGVATALVEAAAEWLAGRGMPRVMLWTAARNEAARRFFERLGFRHTMTEMTREVRPAT
jgi:GNAT superfamily N-acetyltransferase